MKRRPPGLTIGELKGWHVHTHGSQGSSDRSGSFLTRKARCIAQSSGSLLGRPLTSTCAPAPAVLQAFGSLQVIRHCAQALVPKFAILPASSSLGNPKWLPKPPSAFLLRLLFGRLWLQGHGAQELIEPASIQETHVDDGLHSRQAENPKSGIRLDLEASRQLLEFLGIEDEDPQRCKENVAPRCSSGKCQTRRKGTCCTSSTLHCLL